MVTRTKVEKAVYYRSQSVNKVVTTTAINRDFTSIRTGNRLPNWKHIIASGGDATTFMEASTSKGSTGAGVVSIRYETIKAPPWENGNAESLIYGSIVPPAILALSGYPDATSLHNQALARVYNDIRSIHQNMQSGVVIGEFAETLRMFRSPMKRFWKSIDDYATNCSKIAKKFPPRLRHGSNERLRRAISDAYLESVFGWLPVLNDVKDIAKTLVDLHGGSRERVTARGYADKDDLLSSSTSKTSFGNNFFAIQNSQTKGKLKVVYKVYLQPKVPSAPGSLQRLLDLSGVDLSEFAPTLYELAPWSFLVDYFSNVGTLVGAYSTGFSIVVNSVRVDVIYEITNVTAVEPDIGKIAEVYGATFRGCIGSYGRSSSVSKIVERSGSGTLPYPSLEFRMPAMDSQQWLNIAALMKSKS